jgi:hypothetical protein
MAVEPLPAAQSADRAFSCLDQMKRIKAAPHTDDYKGKKLPCSTVIHVGIFFDGTNNNMERDKIEALEKTNDPSKCSHSNVVVLYDTFKDAPKEGYYRFYIPGVGTPFDKIGEKTETPDGKAKATGGDARINWAMLQLLNAMKRSLVGQPLVTDEHAGRLVNTIPLHAGQVIHSNLDGKRGYFTGNSSDSACAGGKVGELEDALKSQGPDRKLVQVNLSVFGFSRGAAQARAFCHFVHHILLKKTEGGYTLAGVPLRIQFLGLFDSVASVGMADASPFWRGLGGWANGTLDIVPSVQRTVHLCAAHEIRINFPLSTARLGAGKYPPNCVEKVYPGAHSNVGGGYPTGSQGKSVGSRARLLSQMPLLDMYREAQLSMVPLQTIEQLQKVAKGDQVANDLKIDGGCAKLFNAYRAWSAGVGGTIEAALHGHTRLYWQWRLQYQGKVKTLPSYTKADPQDRIDMLESDSDFISDMNKALWQEQSDAKAQSPNDESVNVGLDIVQSDFLRVRTDFLGRKPAQVSQDVDRFFDQMVHDSHASFYLVGPVTAYDREQKIKQIEQKIERARLDREQMKRVGSVPRSTTPAQDEAALAWSLSDLERKIYEYQKAHNGAFPEVTDADREELLAMEDMVTSIAVRAVTKKTRREWGGHVRFRRVLDKS